MAVYSVPVRGSGEGKQHSRGCEFSMPVEPGKETFLHHQPLDSRPTLVRPRLSRGWEYDFYPDRIARKSEPATVVLCDGFGIRCISGSRAATTSKSAIIRLAYNAHPQGGQRRRACGERNCVKNLLAARLYGLLILTWRSRTPGTGLTCRIRDCGVCLGKGRYLDTRRHAIRLKQRQFRAGLRAWTSAPPFRPAITPPPPPQRQELNQ